MYRQGHLSHVSSRIVVGVVVAVEVAVVVAVDVGVVAIVVVVVSVVVDDVHVPHVAGQSAAIRSVWHTSFKSAQSSGSSTMLQVVVWHSAHPEHVVTLHKAASSFQEK